LEESETLWREIGDRWGIAWSLAFLGFVASDQGDDAAADRWFAESVPLLRAERTPHRLAAALNKQGNVLRGLGEVERAVSCFEESLALCREFGSQIVLSAPLHNLGFVALQRGEDAHAEAYFAEGLEVARQLRDEEEIGACLAGLAGVAGARGHFERAAQLFGVMEALRAANVESLDRANQIVYDRSMAAVRAQIDEAAFAAAWIEGQAMSLDQAIAYALERSDGDAIASIGTPSST
jgi:tetratricopeptide (TPR) repeat protein